MAVDHGRLAVPSWIFLSCCRAECECTCNSFSPGSFLCSHCIERRATDERYPRLARRRGGRDCLSLWIVHHVPDRACVAPARRRIPSCLRVPVPRVHTLPPGYLQQPVPPHIFCTPLDIVRVSELSRRCVRSTNTICARFDGAHLPQESTRTRLHRPRAKRVP